MTNKNQSRAASPAVVMTLMTAVGVFAQGVKTAQLVRFPEAEAKSPGSR